MHTLPLITVMQLVYACLIHTHAGFDKIVLFLIVFHTVLFAVKWEGMSLATELVIQGTCNNYVFLWYFELVLCRFENISYHCFLGKAEKTKRIVSMNY